MLSHMSQQYSNARHVDMFFLNIFFFTLFFAILSLLPTKTYIHTFLVLETAYIPIQQEIQSLARQVP